MAGDAKEIDASSMSPDELQKAIEEQAKSATKKPAKAKPASKDSSAAAASPEPEPAVIPEPEPDPDPEPEAEAVKVKVSKTRSAISSAKAKDKTNAEKPEPEAKKASKPVISTHTQKIIERRDEPEKETAPKTAPSAASASGRKVEAPKKDETVKDKAESTKPEVSNKAPDKEPISKDAGKSSPAEKTQEAPVDAKGTTAYSSTSIDNLARQLGGEQAKTPLEEAEALQQQKLKTFDSNQYHLPIKPNSHHSAGKDFVYYFIILVFLAGAIAYVSSALGLVDIPILKDL